MEKYTLGRGKILSPTLKSMWLSIKSCVFLIKLEVKDMAFVVNPSLWVMYNVWV